MTKAKPFTFVMPTDRELGENYNDELAAKLLALADATGKVSADVFAGQLWNWATAMAAQLDAGTDHVSQPRVADLRTKFQKLSGEADKLMKSLVNLPVDAYVELGQVLSDGDDLTEYQVKAEAQAYIQQSILQMDELRHTANRAAEGCDGTDTKDGKKNRRQCVRRMATKELGKAWQLLTGKKPTRRVYGEDHPKSGDSYGVFQEFVVAALTPLFGASEAKRGIDDIIGDVSAAMGKTSQKISSPFFH